jgi:transketolase
VDDVKKIEQAARTLRRHILMMVGINQKGHLGGSCSIADVVATLYFSRLRHDPKNPQWPERDRFLLSKGHAALVQYAALAECGYFDKVEMKKVKSLGAMLQGHPDMLTTPGVEANTGSLGQGLSLACGMAAGLKLDGKPNKVYCVCGDGEMAEGQIWEAALGAAHYKLNNLTAFLDLNGLMTNGRTDLRYSTKPLADKWRAFGWHVQEIDGHHVPSILGALDQANTMRGRPKMIICRTIKGKGIPCAEGRAEFHNGTLTTAQYEEASAALADIPA